MPMQDSEELETWENPGQGRVALKKLDVNGRERTELVGGGRKFHLTPRERRMNQELVAHESMDVFTNGTLRPVHLLEGTEDADQLSNNPNHLSESDMLNMIGSHYKKFDERLATITHIPTLHRLLELAERPETNATVRAVAKLRERIEELDPSHVQETTHIATTNDGMAGGMRPVTPK